MIPALAYVVMALAGAATAWGVVTAIADKPPGKAQLLFAAGVWVVVLAQSVIAGVGNAYSDEVLHAAKLSPYAIAGKLGEGEVERLWTAMRTVLNGAVTAAQGKPAKELKDAKRAGMRVHGRAGLPCPVCGDTVREVSFADRAMQYCPTCQTGGKKLADRRMSRLLK